MKPSNTLKSEQKPIKELELLCQSETDSAKLADYYSQLVFQKLHIDLDEAKLWCSKLKILDEKEYNSFVRSKYQNAKGGLLLVSGNLDEALEAFELTRLEREKTPEDYRGLSAIHKNISQCLRLKGDLSAAFKHISISKNYAEESGVEETILNVIIAEVTILVERYHLEPALELLLEGAQRAQKAKLYFLYQDFLRNCAHCYLEVGDFQNSLEMTKRRVASPNFESTPVAVLGAEFAMGACHLRLGDKVNARVCMMKGKEVLDKTDVPVASLLYAYDNLIDLALMEGEPLIAVGYSRELMNRLEKVEASKHLQDGHRIMARSLLAAKDFEKALFHINQVETAIDAGVKGHEVLNVLEIKHQVYKGLQRPDEAYESLLQFMVLDKNLQDKNRIREVELAKAQFDFTIEKAEAEMHRLQKVEFEQKALRAQMNPHFIFNSLNAVRNYINSEEPEIADKFLVEFSKLIRSILSNSNKPYLSLEKNIEFLTSYMSLEAKRFRHSFNFSIEILDDLEMELIQIPTLLIQPFVENAIIHGLQGRQDGHIKIVFSEMSEELIRCTIEDNGKGRKARATEQGTENKSHVSMATDITNQRLVSFGLEKEKGLKVHISDPQDADGKALGTKVSLDIPIRLSL